MAKRFVVYAPGRGYWTGVNESGHLCFTRTRELAWPYTVRKYAAAVCTILAIRGLESFIEEVQYD